jgi:hypothetical protein
VVANHAQRSGDGDGEVEAHAACRLIPAPFAKGALGSRERCIELDKDR